MAELEIPEALAAVNGSVQHGLNNANCEGIAFHSMESRRRRVHWQRVRTPLSWTVPNRATRVASKLHSAPASALSSDAALAP